MMERQARYAPDEQDKHAVDLMHQLSTAIAPRRLPDSIVAPSFVQLERAPASTFSKVFHARFRIIAFNYGVVP